VAATLVLTGGYRNAVLYNDLIIVTASAGGRLGDPCLPIESHEAMSPRNDDAVDIEVFAQSSVR